MRADPKLEAEILIVAEKLQGETNDAVFASQITVQGYKPWQIFEAVRQLAAAKKIIASHVMSTSDRSAENFFIEGLTTEGHAALKAHRDSSLLARTKSRVFSWEFLISAVAFLGIGNLFHNVGPAIWSWLFSSTATHDRASEISPEKSRRHEMQTTKSVPE